MAVIKSSKCDLADNTRRLPIPQDQGGITTSNVRPAANTMYLSPFFLRATDTVNRFGTYINTAQASTFLIARFYTDNAGVPGAAITPLITFPLDSSGALEFNLTGAYELVGEGLIWCVTAANLTTGYLRNYNNSYFTEGAASSNAAQANLKYWSASRTWDADLPADLTGTSWTAYRSSTPALGLIYLSNAV